MKLISLVNITLSRRNLLPSQQEHLARWPYGQCALIQRDDGSAVWGYYSGTFQNPQPTRGAARKQCLAFYTTNPEYLGAGWVPACGGRTVKGAMREVERKREWNRRRTEQRRSARAVATSVTSIA